MGVTTSWKWEEANRVIQNDPDIIVLKSMSERKIAFNDYISEIKDKKRRESR